MNESAVGQSNRCSSAVAPAASPKAAKISSTTRSESHRGLLARTLDTATQSSLRRGGLEAPSDILDCEWHVVPLALPRIRYEPRGDCANFADETRDGLRIKAEVVAFLGKEVPRCV